MEIRVYTVNSITELVYSEPFQRFQHIPVTRHRAISHAHNPRASGEDKILFVAYENEEVIGYIGVLPDILYKKEEGVKIGWLSCFWVDPVYRGKNISTALFLSVMDAWKNKILITNMAPGTIPFYIRTGLFREPVYKEGIRGYMQFNLAVVLPPRRPVFNRIAPALKMLDASANILNNARLLFFPRYDMKKDIRIGFVDDIAVEAEQFISASYGSDFIRRGKEELEWILKYPWILPGKPGDHDSNRYYFSSVAEQFFLQPLLMYDNSGRMIAFLVLSMRNGHITIPFFRGEKETHKHIVKFLLNYMRDVNANSITLFHPELSEVLKKTRTPLVFKKKILRPYLCPKDLDISGMQFQDGDGDAVFT